MQDICLVGHETTTGLSINVPLSPPPLPSGAHSQPQKGTRGGGEWNMQEICPRRSNNFFFAFMFQSPPSRVHIVGPQRGGEWRGECGVPRCGHGSAGRHDNAMTQRSPLRVSLRTSEASPSNVCARADR